MAFYKICACGTKTVFEKRMSYPDFCYNCGRRLDDFQTHDEAEQQEAGTEQETESKVKDVNIDIPVREDRDTSSFGRVKTKNYYLKLGNGKEIDIPPQGCIIGRTETGAEVLGDYPSVSRQHLKISPGMRRGLIIEDISSYGTLADGKRLEKNTPVRVMENTKISLCDLETYLMIREEEK